MSLTRNYGDWMIFSETGLGEFFSTEVTWGGGIYALQTDIFHHRSGGTGLTRKI